MPHHKWRDSASTAAVPAVNVTSTNAAGLNLNEDVVSADFRLRNLGEFQMFVFRQQERFHDKPIDPKVRLNDPPGKQTAWIIVVSRNVDSMQSS